MKPNPNKNYSAADIERYHKGNMSPAEMHALEKAALDDPFLSHAIDGYVHTKTPAADIQFLKQKLQTRSRNVIPIHSRKKQLFLGVAAAVILLAGFGWLAYTSSYNNLKNVAVHTEATPQNKHAPLPQSTQTDSISDASQQSRTPTTDTVKNKEREAALKDPAQDDVAGHGSSIATSQAESQHTNEIAGQTTFSKPHAAPLSKTKSGVATAPLPEAVFNVRVVDVHNKAVPYAIITDVKSKTAATADAAGNLSVAAPDSNLTIAVQSAGFESQLTTLNRIDTPATIVLKRASGSLREVVVTAKNKKEAGNNKVRLEGATPRGGWNQFNAYVEEHLMLPESLKALPEAGTVSLSFDIEKSGKAVNITIDKPLCPSCDSIAVRMIREGSTWKKTKKRGKAKAHFHF